MKTLLKILIPVVVLIGIGWFLFLKFKPQTQVFSSHQTLLEKIEAMGKLQLVKYQFSDIVEHKNVTTFLPDASVLLIVKAEAVGCVDLGKLKAADVQVIQDSAAIVLPSAEVCYVKIDHSNSKVYDTKMAFFREAQLVDEAFKSAEKQIYKEVQQSDILKQTEANAVHVLKPLLEGLGFKKFSLTFK
ncbi:DUF4230 domain-containing protein [Sphingobacterium sp. Mn56C]|uniref:DUF4230 domain-containing protein n=1 Tax=Sphingobacterium sp. Mn56C TaxID=3395261 RepID=UPI003BBF01EA